MKCRVTRGCACIHEAQLEQWRQQPSANLRLAVADPRKPKMSFPKEIQNLRTRRRTSEQIFENPRKQ